MSKYKVKSKVWLWLSSSGSTKGAWHFVTIPPDISGKISKKFHHLKKGWRSLPVLVTIGTGKNRCMFETSIFPNSKDLNAFTYFLPVKKSVRREVGIQDGDILKFAIEIKK